MIYVIIGLGLLFIGIGFILTVNNAKYLLSGYNTMNDEQRKNVNIHDYVRFFRKFHILLGTSLVIIGSGLQQFTPVFAGIFITTYPILAYVYFLWKSSSFYTGSTKSTNKIAIFIMLGTLIFVIGMLTYGLQESELIIDDRQIEIEGKYGEIIKFERIDSIRLVNALPVISMKTNGFGLGTIRKGHFRTKSKEQVKLIINSEQKPLLLLTKSDGKKIFYSAKSKTNQELYAELKEHLPNKCYE
ncbi:MAG: DUF3784 domain-containing protein [Rhodobacteraceae bacterium]|nr:DUF3784 domain-containing protein [Paracoccaceae bacterium]